MDCFGAVVPGDTSVQLHLTLLSAPYFRLTHMIVIGGGPQMRCIFVIALFVVFPLSALAQHAGHEMPGTPPPAQSSEHAQHDMSSMPGMEHDESVAQYGSGTGWLPASAPAHMWMWHPGRWTVMAHANVFLTYNQQGGPRGVGKFESENWVMLMEQRKLGRATLQFQQMLSAEPGTAPPGGFPALFQTGETYRGMPLVDRQHPHDVFNDVSVMLTVPLAKKIDWTIYGGPAGEPALGPVAFIHRPSALNLPAAPLGHHVQDSTHISYGVITSGLRFDRVRVEGSVFNGREPDEERWNFDLGPLDSWSFRVSVAPGRNWLAQYSYGHLTHPEALEPGDVLRQTASLMYNRDFARGNWASTLLYGRNRKLHDNHVQSSYLLESDLRFADKNSAFTRIELVDKDELVHGANFRVAAFTFGGVRELVQGTYGQLGLGADVSFYSKPAAMDVLYGKDPVSFQVFLRFRPPAMKH